MSPLVRSLFGIIAFTGALLIAPSAQSDSLDGTWTASPLRVSWSVGDWGKGCGPRPSGGGEAGGTVTLTAKGAGFTLNGLGRQYSSEQCWEQMPGLTTRSRSAGQSAIQTTCSMPPGDPRRATVITTWYPRGETISFDETGQYQFAVSGSNCTASVRRTRSLSRVKATATTSSKTNTKTSTKSTSSSTQPETGAGIERSSQASTQPGTIKSAPPPPPEQAEQCRSPGPPVRLEVTPRSKLMRSGESFQFSAIARDKDGCRAPVVTTWKLISGEGAKISADGILVVPEGAHAATLRIEATVGQQSVSVLAQVVSDQQFEELLAAGSYGVLGESLDVAEVTLASKYVELDQVEHLKKSQKSSLLWLLGTLIGLAGGVTYMLLRRRHAHKEAAPASQRSSSTSTFADRVAAETPLVVEPEVRAPTADPPQLKRLCPVCGTRYEADSQFCAEDGARLMRVN